MYNDNEVIDCSLVADKNIPAKKISNGKVYKKIENYFFIPATKQFELANNLCRNCLAVYSLLTTALAMHPKEPWSTLPHQQLGATGLDRYQLQRAIAKLVEANIVEVKRQPGHKNRYRLLSRR